MCATWSNSHRNPTAHMKPARIPRSPAANLGTLTLKSSDKPPDSVDSLGEEGKSHWVRAGTSILWLSDRLEWSAAELNWEISVNDS